MGTSQKLLLFIHACFGLASSMSGLFLNLYLWRIANDLSVNAVFMLATFIFALFSYSYGALLSKQKDRLLSFQLGISGTALFYLLVIFLQERTAEFPIIIGGLNGIAAGFYWFGYFILLSELVDQKSQSAFMGKQNALFAVVNTIGPALAGSVISAIGLSGYTIVFGIALILFVTGFLFSLRLPKGPRQSENRLSLVALWGWNKKISELKMMWFGWIVWGACEAIIGFLPTLLLFMTVKSEFLVGISTILFGFIAVLSSLWHAKYNHEQKEPSTLFSVWLLYVASCIPLLVDVNIWSVFSFLIINEVGKALIGVTHFSYMLRLLANMPSIELRTEGMVLREIMVNIGRIPALLLFIWLYEAGLQWAISLFFATVLLQGLLFKMRTVKKQTYHSKENASPSV